MQMHCNLRSCSGGKLFVTRIGMLYGHVPTLCMKDKFCVLLCTASMAIHVMLLLYQQFVVYLQVVSCEGKTATVKLGSLEHH